MVALLVPTPARRFGTMRAMDGWSELLDHLTQTPRENGTTVLDATASWLVDTLTRIGLQVQTVEWTAHPWRLRIVGVGAFLASVAYVVLLQRKKSWGALAVGLLVPLWIVVELDVGVPVLGWIHPSQEKHVVARVAPTEAPRQRLIFSAHYDTKTDLLDHVERAPFTFLGLPLAALLVLVAAVSLRWKMPRLVRAAQVAALVNGVGQVVVQTGGAIAPRRSPGARDLFPAADRQSLRGRGGCVREAEGHLAGRPHPRQRLRQAPPCATG